MATSDGDGLERAKLGRFSELAPQFAPENYRLAHRYRTSGDVLTSAQAAILKLRLGDWLQRGADLAPEFEFKRRLDELGLQQKTVAARCKFADGSGLRALYRTDGTWDNRLEVLRKTQLGFPEPPVSPAVEAHYAYRYATESVRRVLDDIPNEGSDHLRPLLPLPAWVALRDAFKLPWGEDTPAAWVEVYQAIGARLRETFPNCLEDWFVETMQRWRIAFALTVTGKE